MTKKIENSFTNIELSSNIGLTIEMSRIQSERN